MFKAPVFKAPVFQSAVLASLLTVSALMPLPALAGPQAMTAAEARHLLARTGFGAAPHEITAFTGLSYAEGVARIMGDLRTTAATPLPAWADDWAYPYDAIYALGDTATDLFYANRYVELETLQAWWLAEMVATPSPLTEKLTLFWADHFANSFEVHENPQWMARQNAYLRAHAAGDFAAMAQGMLLDPAMLDYLSNTTNTADAPNEDLAREFLELFMLGEGRGYTQGDVRAAARALTGYTVSEEGAPVFMFDAAAHDSGMKTLFGQTGRYDADDLVTLTLEHPAFGPYVVEKMWRLFVSDQPDAAVVADLAEVWRAADWQIAPLVEALLMSDAFWDASNRGRLVKSPVDLMVGTVRTLGLEMADGRVMGWMTGELGQALFMPPNVGGWPEGVGWINDATAAGRATTLTYLMWDAAETQAADMRMPPPQAPVSQTDLGPEDLRVGQVFATYFEPRAQQEGAAGSLVLYDVSFGGQTWRSLPLWFDYDAAEDWAAAYIHTGDCAPTCFVSLPRDPEDPHFIALEPWDGIVDYWDGDTAADRALAAAIAGHFPALIASTADQRVYRQSDEGDAPADLSAVLQGAEVFAELGAEAYGRTGGVYVSALSHARVLGLAGYRQGEADVDAMIEGVEAAARRPIAPPVTYATGRDWINALPGAGLESARVAQALLAVARPAQGLRDELIVGEPEALIRTLILLPEYQVN
ncbi:DUF1800 domain-containing protein [Pseudooctadecabacter jejudonensis]|uniref:DUF1800 domain-containing protein n=1 Tax=Pseudooctadecabacter jejudonensis TaxID=1391910 RepID=A0A1Y5RLY2_9RHOB|nr:DUF1800 domain-containing protein [Pseudooctadecabacter jejudonensis]SLN20548.1 hypothetical protein PSJ8397_00769 [Pseudooctadecabacter jejudonensis]